MKFSGTSAPSTINLQQPNSSNDGDDFAGQGTLGSFAVTNVRPISNSPGTSALAQAQMRSFSRNWPAQAFFGSRMAVYWSSISPREGFA